MSTTVDQRVVEMRFDNQQFERNVSTTMSTIEKLKSKLNFSGAGKGLTSLAGHAGVVQKNMDVLSRGVQNVQAEFSGLQVIGATCLVNITNAAIRAGKNIVNALTLDPVKTGFNEYETKINAIQTILANTSSKGENIESVTRVIDELNTYADKTIYNFAEMTRNIGTFTAAGVGLQESADAIQGIANVAAMSGSTSQQASTAMYQLSQALAAGTVKLMDWNSVVNAGMGGEKLQNALKQTAREFGIDVDSMIADAGSFRESLQQGWITADVLNTTLQKFTVKGAKEYAQAMLESGQYTQEQADALMREAQIAEDAATKVKTLTQLWDTLKETAQSGWGKTWELVVGDFEEAKEFFTNLSNTFGPMIDAMSDARNNLLEGALSSKWDQFASKIKDAGISMDTFQSKLKEVAAEKGHNLDKLIETYGSLGAVFRKGRLGIDDITETLKRLAGVSEGVTNTTENMADKLAYFQDVVDKVWAGDYGNGADRVKALTEANYDYNTVQDLVNKTVDGHRLTLEDLSDAQLANIGFTESEVESLRKLAEEAEKTGVPIEELIEKEFDLTRSFTKKSGRELLLESLQNVIQGVIKLCSTLKQAWREVFPPMTSDRLYGIIEGLNEFSKKLIMSDETAEKLKRTFKGLFALIDIITTIMGGSFRVAIKVLNAVLAMFNLDILDATASVGDLIVQFRDWIKSTFDITKALEIIVPPIKKAVSAFIDWIKVIRESDDPIGTVISGIKKGIGTAFDWIKSKLSEGLSYISEKLGGFKLDTSIFKNLLNLGKSLITNIIDGLKEKFPKLVDTIKGGFGKVIDFIKGLDFNKIAAGFMLGGILYTINHVANAMESFGSLFESVGKFVDTLGKTLKAYAFNAKAKAILSLAIAVGVLVASIYVLAKLQPDELKQALLALTGLISLLIILAFTTSKLGTAVDSMGKTGSVMMLAGSLIIIAAALKLMSTIDGEGLKNAAIGMTVALGTLALLMLAVNKLGTNGNKMKGAGLMLLKMAAALAIMVFVIKKAGELDKGQVLRGIAVIGAVELLFLAAIAVSKLAGRHASSAGSMLLKMSIAMGIMLFVVKMASKISRAEVRRAQGTLWTIEGLFIALITVSKLAGKDAAKAGTLFILTSIAMSILVGVVKKAASLSPEEVDKGTDFIIAAGVMFGILMTVSKLAGQNAAKAGTMFIGVGVAMLLLAASIRVISDVPVEDLKKATIAIGALMLVMSVMMAASGLARNAKGTMIALAVAVAILAGVLIALSYIPFKDLMGATAALGVIMLSFAAVLYSAKSLEKVKMGKIIVMFAAMSILMGLIAGVLTGMSELGVQNALPNAAALGTLLLAMSGAMLILGKIGNVNANTAKVLLALEGLSIVVATLAFILYQMNDMNPTNGLINAVTLSIFINALCAAMVVLSQAKAVSINALGGVAALSLVCGILAFILYQMNDMDAANGLTNAIALSIFINALSAAMIVLSLAKTVSIKALGGVVALSAVCYILALILNEMNDMNPTNALMNAITLSIFINALSAAMVILSLAKGVSLMALGGVLALSAVCYILALVLKEIDKIDPEGAIANATALSILIIALSGAMILLGVVGAMWQAALIGVGCLAALALVLGLAIIGFQKFIGPGLPLMGMQLSMFAMALEPFIESMKKIDDSALQGCKNIAAMLTALAGSAILDSIMSLFGGDNWAQSLKQPLLDFGDAMVGFSNKLTEGNFNATAVNAAANAGKMISELQNSLPRTGGKIGDTIEACIGKKDMNGFSQQLVGFGAAMCLFSNTVKDIDPVAVESAANAGKMLTEMANTIPNSGGKLAEFLGDNTMDVFGTQLISFGLGLSMFSKTISGDNAIDPEAVSAAAEAGKALADMANEIPNEGGWMAKIVGDNKIDLWGAKLPIFGLGLKGFSDAVKGVDGENIKAAAEAGKALAEMAANIPNEGGWISKIVGDNKLDVFAENIGELGKGMKSFSNNVTGLNPEAISNAATAAGNMKTVVNNLPSEKDMKGKISGESIQKLDAVLPSLMTTLSTASGLIGNVDTTKIAAAVADVSKLTDMLTDIGNSSFGGVDGFVSAMNELGTVSVDNFVNAFNNGAEKAATAAKNMLDKTLDCIKFNVYKFKEGGKRAVEYFAEGISNNTSKAETAVSTMMSNIETTIRNRYTDLYNAGGYLIDGLKAGIADNAYKAAEAASNAMVEAVKAAKQAAGINSPSKVFYEMGEFTIAGFTNALDDLGGKVRASASNMAENAHSGFSNAISSIADAFNGEIGTQPTIRPVLDMSAVTAGAGTINRLFGTPSVGLLSNVSSINSMMANRQNGVGNSDVVSAIDKLRNELGNVGGTTNYINGVTYDDGSNVSDAVATLVRAARIERRR